MARDVLVPRQATQVTSRRTFNRLLIGFFIAAPCNATAQRQTVVRRIGRLEAGAPEKPEVVLEEEAPLRELGWMEGRNLYVERRYANWRLEALPALAEELVRSKVEIIVTTGPNPTRAAMRATNTIPIVFRLAADPVGSGLVASLAHPAGNVTGFSADSPEVTPKLLTLLKELLPALRHIGLLEVSDNPYFRLTRPEFQQICRLLGVEPVFIEVSAAGEIDGAIAKLARERAQALVLLPDSFIVDHRSEIVSAALKQGLPTVVNASFFVRDAGALASYSAIQAEVDRRVAYYIDRILRGAKPADLPVEQPTQFELVINLKTAKALGIAVPQSLLLRADEVIQ